MNIDDTIEIPDPALAAPPAASPASTPPMPRTRWAAILWGLVFAGLAATGLWLLSDEGRRNDLTDWLLAQTPSTITAIALLTVGGLILVVGAIGLIRGLQRRRAASST